MFVLQFLYNHKMLNYENIYNQCLKYMYIKLNKSVLIKTLKMLYKILV